MANFKQIIITTGDTDGIGQEITLKSFLNVKPSPQLKFIIFTSNKNTWPEYAGDFRFHVFDSENEIKIDTLDSHDVAVCQFNTDPHHWVKRAAERALFYSNTGAALVNAPMSKDKRGYGHTEILKDVCKNDSLFMGFLGDEFSVCLSTTHIQIDNVFNQLNSVHVENSYKATMALHRLGDGSQQVKVLGLNPHSGENGAISNQDLVLKERLPCCIKNLLVPDVAFLNFQKRDTFLAWYHDQGLIPFKMVHGFSKGIQVTLGLPFIRTSVDHGTAKDIFGKNIANHHSMLLAIQKGIDLVCNHSNTIFLKE